MMEIQAVRLPKGKSAQLGPLRTFGGLEIHETGEVIWLRVRETTEEIQTALKSLPAATAFRVLEDGQLCQWGNLVPQGFLPAGPWQSLSQWMAVELPSSSLSGRLTNRLPLDLVRDNQPREANLLLTTLDHWLAYGRTAPQIRLDRLQFAVSGDGEVLIRGLPLPPIPGKQFIEERGSAIPCGWRRSMARFSPRRFLSRAAVSCCGGNRETSSELRTINSCGPHARPFGSRGRRRMLNISAQVNGYLTPGKKTFWNWSEDGEAVVWANSNQTIVFRPELAAILRRHLSKGLPRFGSILLLLAICRDSWGEARSQWWDQFTVNELMGDKLDQIDHLHGIPAEIRRGTAAKAELSAMIFETVGQRTSTEVAAAIVEALSQGLATEMVRRDDIIPLASPQMFLDEYMPLWEGLERFDVEAFQLRLETGLEKLPVPTEAQEPLATRIRKLFDRLQNDEEFSGLVRLARNLLAMVSLPRPLIQPDEIPVGGVSDIANGAKWGEAYYTGVKAAMDVTLAMNLFGKDSQRVSYANPIQILKKFVSRLR